MKTITILAIIAILAGASILATVGPTAITSVLAQTMDNATMGNMTGGNMTGGNMTDTNATGSISKTRG
jgi:hypothetical protein